MELRNGDLLLRLCDRTGCIERMCNVRTGWELAGADGDIFTMNVPIPKYDDFDEPDVCSRNKNLICGRAQTLTRLTPLEHGVELYWAALQSPFGGALPISFTARIEAAGEGFRFSGRVENRSDYVIEQLGFPALPCLQKPRQAARFVMQQTGYTHIAENELYPRFNTDVGYWSSEFPFKRVATVDSPFLLLEGGGEGLYVGFHTPAPRYAAFYFLELLPSVADASTREWSTPLDDGTFCPHLSFAVDHFPFLAPGGTLELVPVQLAPYVGSWEAGARYYKEYRRGWQTDRQAPAWVLEGRPWFQVQLNSYGDGLRYRYSDLVDIGRRCRDNGVAAIQLTGWTRQGQDGCTPSLDIDPRLGSWQELRDAIAAVEAMGVHIILYCKFIFADTRTDWYRRTLADCVSKDVYGDAQTFAGYPYERPSLLCGINPHRLGVMCTLSEQWQAVCVEELKKCLALGASGILADESQHHCQYSTCFAPDHGHPVPGFLFAGDVALGRKLRAACVEAGRPDFLIAGEGCYDLESPVYQLAYIRADRGVRSSARFYAPQYPILNGFWGFNDRNSVNICLLHRYIMELETRQFKGMVDEFGQTLAYAGKVEALRRRYAALLWDGEQTGSLGAAVSSDWPEEVQHSVFNAADGGRAVVAIHYGDAPACVSVRFSDGHAPACVVTPEQPDRRPYTDGFLLPPRSAAVFLSDASEPNA